MKIRFFAKIKKGGKRYEKYAIFGRKRDE